MSFDRLIIPGLNGDSHRSASPFGLHFIDDPSIPSPTLDQQQDSWSSWLASSVKRLLYGGDVAPTPQHPLRDYVQRVKEVVVIGVHGWAVVGGVFSSPPKNMSEKLSSNLENAIRHRVHDLHSRLLLQHEEPVNVTTISVAGHGIVENRVKDYVTGQLPDYREVLMKADAVLLSSHSQGVLVGVSLLSELVSMGWIRPEVQSVGVLSLAGVHHGPFPDLPGDMYSSTKELFLFSQPYSAVSERHMSCLAALLHAGVRIVCVASWLDQVVPVHSALAHSIRSHPNLLRCLFVDERHRRHTHGPTSPFLLALVSLCAKVRNHGFFDDLLPHLSGFLRGSLLERPRSHSTIHDESEVYSLAALWCLQPSPEPCACHPRPTETEESEEEAVSEDSVIEPPKPSAGTHPFGPLAHAQASCHRHAFNASDALLYRERDAAVHLHSAVEWGELFRDTFVTSELNLHLIRLRMVGLLSLAMSLDMEEEVRELCTLCPQWTPKTYSLRTLQRVLSSVLNPDYADVGESEDVEEVKEAENTRVRSRL